MPLPLHQYDTFYVWPSLSLGLKFFVFVLCAVSLYTAYVAVTVFTHLRSLNPRAIPQKPDSPPPVLHHRLANLHQALLFTFYFFTFVFLLNIPNATVTLGDSKSISIGLILLNLAALVEYATDVLLILLILHSLQWLTSMYLYSYVRRHLQLPITDN
jgi:hypothetical protein